MQLSYYPAAALRITGSEESSTHKGTKCLDQALNSTNVINDPWMYAPFDCKIWRIYTSSNGLFLTSVEPVQTPTFVDHVSFYIGHMNDEDFLPMKYKVGQVIKQGQKFYREGVKGYATGEHVHLNFGRGTFVGNGWAKNAEGNWGLTTTDGETHIWETTYLKTGMQKFEGTSAASGYPWVYEPIPATMQSVSDMSIINDSSSNINIRWKPSTKFAVVGKISPGTKLAISEKSIDEADGYFWVKLSDNTGYSAIISEMQLIDETEKEEEKLPEPVIIPEPEPVDIVEPTPKPIQEPAPEPIIDTKPIEPTVDIPEWNGLLFKIPSGGYSIMRIASMFRVKPNDIYFLNKELIHVGFNKSLPIGIELKLPKGSVQPYSQPVRDIVPGSRVRIIGQRNAFGFPIPQMQLARSHVVVKIVGEQVTLDSSIIVNITNLKKA